MPMKKDDSEMNTAEAETLALRALAHVIADSEQGPRLLALTGLDVAGLRARAAEPAVLAATLDFLMAHEPSLLDCANALDLPPARLVAARARL